MKHAKKAFLASVLSVVLCVTMLVGTTYAWFTDSVTSAGNKIIAGELKIDLLQDLAKNGEYTSIKTNSAPIFGSASSTVAQNVNADTLWEPGKTQIAYLQLENKGNLWLKYTVRLIVTNVAKNLYEVMNYKIVPDATAASDLEALSWTTIQGTATPVGTTIALGATETVATTAVEVPMAPGAKHNFALAIHMAEEAGNEYQAGEVDFDLQVLATQYTMEEDSFDELYDELAEGFSTSVSGTYSEDGGTTLVTGNTKQVGNAKVTVPAGATLVGGEPLADGEGVNLTVEKTETPANFEVETESNGTTTYEVSLETDSGAKIQSTGDAFVVELNIGVVDLKNFYHNNTKLTKGTDAASLNTNEYVYDEETGIVTFKTTSFSPFTSEYLFAGGLGTEKYPYLIASVENFNGITGMYQTAPYYYQMADEFKGQEFDCRNWSSVKLWGSFDGNGVIFKNLDRSLFYEIDSATKTNASAATLENFTISDCKIITQSYYTAIVCRYTEHSIEFKNIDVSGYLEAIVAATFIGQGNYYDEAADFNATFSNCHSTATLCSTGSQVGGFTGNLFGNYYNKSSNCIVTLNDSSYTGAAVSTDRGGYVSAHTIYASTYTYINYTEEPTETLYSNYSNGCQLGNVLYTKAFTKTTPRSITLPDKGETLTITKDANATRAIAMFIVGLNPGNFTNVIIKDTIDLSEVVEETFSTVDVKNYDVVFNDGIHETSVEGTTQYIARAGMSNTYHCIVYSVIQYDENGAVTSISTLSLPGNDQ